MSNTIDVIEHDDINAAEYSIECHGLSFLCIIGEHINGKFITIVNWGVSAELSANANDIGYNTDRIHEALKRAHCAGYLPNDENARYMIAQDIAIVIKGVIGQWKEYFTFHWAQVFV